MIFFQDYINKLKSLFSYKTWLVLGVVVIFIIITIIFLSQKEKRAETGLTDIKIKKYGVLNSPEFLNNQEKKDLNISQDLKVQALKRNQKGAPIVYKIINNETDIINNPSLIKPISPQKATSTN